MSFLLNAIHETGAEIIPIWNASAAGLPREWSGTVYINNKNRGLHILSFHNLRNGTTVTVYDKFGNIYTTFTNPSSVDHIFIVVELPKRCSINVPVNPNGYKSILHSIHYINVEYETVTSGVFGLPALGSKYIEIDMSKYKFGIITICGSTYSAANIYNNDMIYRSGIFAYQGRVSTVLLCLVGDEKILNIVNPSTEYCNVHLIGLWGVIK